MPVHFYSSIEMFRSKSAHIFWLEFAHFCSLFCRPLLHKTHCQISISIFFNKLNGKQNVKFGEWKLGLLWMRVGQILLMVHSFYLIYSTKRSSGHREYAWDGHSSFWIRPNSSAMSASSFLPPSAFIQKYGCEWMANWDDKIAGNTEWKMGTAIGWGIQCRGKAKVVGSIIGGKFCRFW